MSRCFQGRVFISRRLDLVETKLTEASSIVSHLLAGVHDAGQPPSALHRGAPHALVEADVRKN